MENIELCAKKAIKRENIVGDILTFDGSAPGLSLMRYRLVSAFESSSPSSEFARYESQMLKLAGLSSDIFKLKGIPKHHG